MKTVHICSILSLLPTSIILCACATLPQSDPHTVLDTTPPPLSGQRLEAAHLGEHLDIPVPGKVTVLDFWASSCPPCLKAMPELERLWQQVDKEKVVIIGISEDETDEVSRKTLAQEMTPPITFAMVWDDLEGAIQATYEVGGVVPATYVIDTKGRIRFFFDGSSGDMMRLEQAIEVLADE